MAEWGTQNEMPTKITWNRNCGERLMHRSRDALTYIQILLRGSMQTGKRGGGVASALCSPRSQSTSANSCHLGNPQKCPIWHTPFVQSSYPHPSPHSVPLTSNITSSTHIQPRSQHPKCHQHNPHSRRFHPPYSHRRAQSSRASFRTCQGLCERREGDHCAVHGASPRRQTRQPTAIWHTPPRPIHIHPPIHELPTSAAFNATQFIHTHPSHHCKVLPAFIPESSFSSTGRAEQKPYPGIQVMFSEHVCTGLRTVTKPQSAIATTKPQNSTTPHTLTLSPLRQAAQRPSPQLWTRCCTWPCRRHPRLRRSRMPPSRIVIRGDQLPIAFPPVTLHCIPFLALSSAAVICGSIWIG